MNNHVFLDADGVVLDFNRAARHALRLAGYIVEEREPQIWDWYQPLGISDDQFWEAVHDLGADFYNQIVKVYPWSGRLIRLLRSVGKVSFLTRLSKSSESSYGKLLRLEREFPGVPIITMSHDEKYLLAGPGRILIDDKNENIDSFRNDAGTGIFWPQPWNRAGLTFYDGQGNERLEYVRHQLTTNNYLCKG